MEHECKWRERDNGQTPQSRKTSGGFDGLWQWTNRYVIFMGDQVSGSGNKTKSKFKIMRKWGHSLHAINGFNGFKINGLRSFEMESPHCILPNGSNRRHHGLGGRAFFK